MLSLSISSGTSLSLSLLFFVPYGPSLRLLERSDVTVCNNRKVPNLVFKLEMRFSEHEGCIKVKLGHCHWSSSLGNDPILTLSCDIYILLLSWHLASNDPGPHSCTCYSSLFRKRPSDLNLYLKQEGREAGHTWSSTPQWPIMSHRHLLILLHCLPPETTSPSQLK